MYNIHQTIRNFREQQNLKQSYISHEIGMTQTNYSKMEQGQINLTIANLYKISLAMNTHIINIIVSHELGIVFKEDIIEALRPLHLTEAFLSR